MSGSSDGSVSGICCCCVEISSASLPEWGGLAAVAVAVAVEAVVAVVVAVAVAEAVGHTVVVCGSVVASGAVP